MYMKYEHFEPMMQVKMCVSKYMCDKCVLQKHLW